MAAFDYRAVDMAGGNTAGVVEAGSATAARAELRARNLLPVSVEPASARSARAGRVGTRAQVVVTRQLATLVGAGVRIEDALRTVAEEASSPKAKSLLLTLRASVVEGQSFADALDTQPGQFDAYFRASVRAGEASGRLGEVLDHLADFTERRAKNRQTVTFALLYPALLAVVSVGVIIALLVFVVPDIVRSFETRGAELPLLTRGLIAASDAFAQYGVAAAIALGLALAASAWAMRQPAMRLGVHRALARTWPVRDLVLRLNASQYAGTLATLVVSRVPLAEALDAAASAVSNDYVRAAAREVSNRVREGTALSVAMRAAGVFPPRLTAMVASGEAGGTLGRTLSRAADDQARDLQAMVAAVVSLVEPAVLLVMGLLVLLLVLSILLPITNLNTLAV